VKLLFEDSKVHRDSNSQSGSSLGSVGVHSLTLTYTLRSMKCDSRALILAHTFASPCLGRELKAGVGTSTMLCYPLSSSFSSSSFLMSNLFVYSAFTLFFLQISTFCLYPFWKSFSLSISSYNITFSFSPINNIFFIMFTSKVKFPVSRFIIAMV
jgi:hypothetical protein